MGEEKGGRLGALLSFFLYNHNVTPSNYLNLNCDSSTVLGSLGCRSGLSGRIIGPGLVKSRLIDIPRAAITPKAKRIENGVK